jgi:Zn-dependent protease
MQKNWRIGSLFGIPLYLDSSWLIILVLVTTINAGELHGNQLVQQPFLDWVLGFVMALLLFTSVLLHELGHSLVAKSQGIKVNSITLFLFGGIAAIDRESNTPGQAFQVAIAGPLVSLGLFVIFGALAALFGEASLGEFITSDLARINLVLGLFNLIPGLPLDGGQVLKSIVWKITNNPFTGVHWASATGKAIGWFGISLGVFFWLVTGSIGTIWIALIGWFVLRNANAYDRLTTIQEILLELTAADAMTREYRVVNAHLTLREFAEQYVLTDVFHPIPYFAASEGRYRGKIKIQDLQNVERSLWDQMTLLDLAHSLDQIVSVEEKTPLFEVINTLEDITESQITVLSPAGAVSGIIDRGDIVRAIANKQNLEIPESEIKRIKEEGSYPPGFQLNLLAKTVQNFKSN